MRKLVLWGHPVEEHLDLFGLKTDDLNIQYVPVSDYHLPFADFEFDFALSSHYLFEGLHEQGAGFYLQILRELARVAKEVRIFPLVDRNGQPSPVLGPVLLGLQQEGYGVEVREVKDKGHAMLRLWAQQCQIQPFSKI